MANSSTTSTTTTSNSTSICSESNYSSAPPQNFYLDEKWKLSKKLDGSSPRIRRCSSKRCGFASKCARLVKEQRARFYIMRRCVIMLICWRDYSDS